MFMQAVYVVGLLVLAWFLGTVFVTIFQCRPMNGAWLLEENPKCIDFHSFVLASGITAFILDVIILCMPMPLIWGLQLSIRRKVVVTFTFLLGARLAE